MSLNTNVSYENVSFWLNNIWRTINDEWRSTNDERPSSSSSHGIVFMDKYGPVKSTHAHLSFRDQWKKWSIEICNTLFYFWWYYSEGSPFTLSILFNRRFFCNKSLTVTFFFYHGWLILNVCIMYIYYTSPQSPRSRITNHKSRITNHESRITNHKSQITYQFLILQFYSYRRRKYLKR